MARLIRYLRQMLDQPQHFVWVVLQQGAVRGILALKFLLVARLLGPEQIGLVGIALLALAVVESLSDTGLAQAIVQRPDTITASQAGAVWTLQMCRGAVLAILLLAFSIPVSVLFSVPASAQLVALAALVPLLRNSFNPGLYVVQRKRDFKKLSIYEVIAALLDISTSLILARSGVGAASLLVGSMVSDASKMIFTWTWFRLPLKVSFQWSLIKEFTAFGKWIWGSSVVTLVLNQLDKVLVAKFLGTAEFGLYQTANRIAQLVVADGVVALSQYLYPTFSQRFRVSPEKAYDFYIWVIKRVVPVVACISILLAVFSTLIIQKILGDQWVASAPVLRIMAVTMFFGAIIAVLVAYTRAIGNPQIVTKSVTAQLIVFVLLAPLLTWKFGGVGMASASACALACATYAFIKQINKSKF